MKIPQSCKAKQDMVFLLPITWYLHMYIQIAWLLIFTFHFHDYFDLDL